MLRRRRNLAPPPAQALCLGDLPAPRSSFPIIPVQMRRLPLAEQPEYSVAPAKQLLRGEEQGKEAFAVLGSFSGGLPDGERPSLSQSGE